MTLLIALVVSIVVAQILFHILKQKPVVLFCAEGIDEKLGEREVFEKLSVGLIYSMRGVACGGMEEMLLPTPGCPRGSWHKYLVPQQILINSIYPQFAGLH